MIAGTGAESVRATLEMTEAAAELGYDAALVRTPHYYKSQMTPAVMLNFYRTVADRSPLPVLIYSVPPFTGYDIPTEVVRELADHPNILGIKESSGSVEKIKQMAEETATCAKATASVFATVEGPHGYGSGGRADRRDDRGRREDSGSRLPDSRRIGAENVALAAGRSVRSGVGVRGCSAGRLCECSCCFPVREIRRRPRRSRRRLFNPPATIASQLSIPGVKYAMDFNGYYGGNPRLPLLPVSARSASRNREAAGRTLEAEGSLRTREKGSSLKLPFPLRLLRYGFLRDAAFLVLIFLSGVRRLHHRPAPGEWFRGLSGVFFGGLVALDRSSQSSVPFSKDRRPDLRLRLFRCAGLTMNMRSDRSLACSSSSALMCSIMRRVVGSLSPKYSIMR